MIIQKEWAKQLLPIVNKETVSHVIRF